MIVGDGPIRNHLNELAKPDPRILITGYLMEDAVKKTIRNELSVVVPSEWYENAPMTILEALALGKPVIAGRIGGIPEMVDDGVNGFLFRPGDIEDLRNNLEMFCQLPVERIMDMGRAGRKKVEREYSAELHYEQLMRIYSAAIRS